MLSFLNLWYSLSKATNIINNIFQQYKNNPNYFGQTFEDIDVGQSNIKINAGEQKYTTDELADIKKVAEINASGKRTENLNNKINEKS